MTFFFNILKDSYPGYAGVFACCGLGFLFLGRVDGKDVGPGYWALAFFMNSLGFLFWSAFFPLPVRLYLLLGEIFHMCGFFLLAEGKDPDHLAEIVLRLAVSAGRCIATRVSREQADRIKEAAERNGIATEYREKAQVLLTGNGPVPKRTGGIVAIITAGTSDIRVAEEARAIAEEMGCGVLTAYDVGAAGIHRLFPALKPLLAAHAFVVCAGREGTLPAVVAGLVDKPVIGIPVSVGYGYMGEGRAALASMLQSCSVIAVVNIDAGFTGGAFAARIANLGAGGKP